jgi:LDH2 family malate/lactate/ureidoglycolate dehydrogenase
MASYLGDGISAGENDPDWFSNAGAFLFVDPLRFTEKQRIEERVKAFNNTIRSATYTPEIPLFVATKNDQAILPGEVEYQTYLRRTRAGIPLPDETKQALNELASELDVENSLNI